MSTGPFTHPLARSLAMLTHSLSLHCSLRLRAPLRSFLRSFARSPIHSLPSSWERGFCRFHAVLTHCGPRARACVCVCVCVHLFMRVCMQVSSLHFVSIVKVGNKRFRKFEKNGLRTVGRTHGRTDRPSYRDARMLLKGKTHTVCKDLSLTTFSSFVCIDAEIWHCDNE